MLHKICVIAGILSTLMSMTPAVAHEYGVRAHHEQKYGPVHAHGNYVRRRLTAGVGRPSAGIGRAISGEINVGNAEGESWESVADTRGRIRAVRFAPKADMVSIEIDVC